MSEVTIIIPTYNRPNVLEETLESLYQMKTDVDYSLIVVDDSEGKETKQACLKHELDIEYLRPEESNNTSYAKNFAWRRTEALFIAFIDDDVYLHDYWIDELIDTLEEAGVAGGPAIDISNGEPTHEIIRSHERLNTVDKGFVKDESYRWIPPETVKVDSLRGANQAFRREVLEDTGGFDECYIGNCFREETDLHIRAQRQDYNVLYNPEARVDHREVSDGGTRDKSKEFWYSLGYNQRRFVEKLFPEHRKLHLLNFLFAWNYASYSLPKILVTAIKNLELERLDYIKGIVSKGGVNR